MSDQSIPSPSFTGPDPNFLAFSSTPIQGKTFTPKWGKGNRQNNWRRFGEQFGDNGSPGNQLQSPRGNFRGNRGPGGQWRSPNNSHHGQPRYPNQGYNEYQPHSGSNRRNDRGHNWNGGNWRQSPGSWKNSPNNSWGNSSHTSSGSSSGGYQSHGGPQSFNSGGKSFVHPSMTGNPWQKLERNVAEKQKMSDSMVPQVGDSLLERNEEIADSSLELSQSITEDSSSGSQ